MNRHFFLLACFFLLSTICHAQRAGYELPSRPSFEWILNHPLGVLTTRSLAPQKVLMLLDKHDSHKVAYKGKSSEIGCDYSIETFIHHPNFFQGLFGAKPTWITSACDFSSGSTLITSWGYAYTFETEKASEIAKETFKALKKLGFGSKRKLKKQANTWYFYGNKKSVWISYDVKTNTLYIQVRQDNIGLFNQ